MNRTKIEWADYTWNPITGCNHGCPYCYARRMAFRLKGRAGYPVENPFSPTWHSDRLNEPLLLKQSSRIFTVSMGDMWGAWVPGWWQCTILEIIKDCPQHTFIILTKDPNTLVLREQKIGKFPDNLWLGVSVTGDDDEARLNTLRDLKHPNKFVSFEPLLAPVTDNGWFTLEGIKWVIIGAQTGPGAHQPKQEWVAEIENQANGLNIPVFLKNNLNYYHGVHDFPKSFSREKSK